MHAPEQGTGQAQTQALGLRSIVVSDIVTKIIEKKLSQLEEQMSDGQSELRAKLLEHSKSVSAEIDKLRRDTTAALNREVDVLRDEKTDRASLADLFNEFSLRLKNKFELPEE